MNIVEVMIATKKTKLMQKINKIKTLTSRDYIKKKILSGMREYFYSYIDVRPQNERDYYIFWRWLVSKRLAMAAVLVISVFCTVFLWNSKPARIQGKSTMQSYRYDSLFLKFVTGNVQILGKSGYTAYIGEVEKGTVKGRGTLYGLEGNIIYEGDFDTNAYNGTGKYYYESGRLAYEGAFRDNLYCGEGKLYRNSGTLWYEGNFNRGQMDGEGTLYSATGKEIYSGNFQNGQIIYQELIGKDTTDIAGRYMGDREIYIGENIYCVYLKDIDALYFGTDRSNTLEEAFKVSGLYVLQSYICLDGRQLNEITQFQEVFGSPVYEGNTLLEADDEIALNTMCMAAGRDVLYGKAGYREQPIYDDVKEVSDFDRDYQAYIYVYEREGIAYTFFCKDKNKGFDFYRME